MKIYLDYASTTPLLPEVKQAMINVMDEIPGNPSSIHSIGRKAKTTVEEARKIIAEILNASIGDVFFTAGASESNNLILRSAIQDLGIKRIVSATTEHHCITVTLEALQKDYPDLEVVQLPVDPQGKISYEQLEQSLQNEAPSLISLMHANNEIGTMSDMDKIARIAEDHGALYHSDIAQSFGKYPFDVQKTKVHFLSASAHKLYGPKGTGFAYINNETQLKPLIYGGSQERNMRAGTENVMGIHGFATAASLAYAELDSRKETTQELRQYFEDRIIAEIPGTVLNGTREDLHLYNVASISFPPHEKSDLLAFNLDIAGICISSGSACSSGVENDSHVLQAIGHDPLRKTIRFSLSHLNNKEQLNHTIEKLKEICS